MPSLDQDTIDCENLAYIEPKKNQNKTNSKKKYIKEILCYNILKFLKTLPLKHEKSPSLVAHNRPKYLFFFSAANWPKTSPKIPFCSKKCVPAQLLCDEFALRYLLIEQDEKVK